ncbi:MAG: hypothetical protein JO308_03100 [Verrucomicrobia bacterium]|nr:hypothetical protein [Verrucomicrobiota bacterium]
MVVYLSVSQCEMVYWALACSGHPLAARFPNPANSSQRILVASSDLALILKALNKQQTQLQSDLHDPSEDYTSEEMRSLESDLDVVVSTIASLESQQKGGPAIPLEGER